MNYVRTDDLGNIVDPNFSLHKLRELYPNTSFPKDPKPGPLAGFNIFPVTDLPQPGFNGSTHRLVRQEPVKQGQNYIRGWDVIPLTPAELTARGKAAARNKFEADERDFNPDMTVVDKLVGVMLFDEVQRYRADNTVPTPLMDDIKTFVYPVLTIAQIANTIENRTAPYAKNAAVAWARKVQAGA